MTSSLLIVCLAVSVLIVCAPAQAQFRLDIERVALDLYAEETVSPSPMVDFVGNRVANRNFGALRMNLDQIVFNQHKTSENAKKHLKSELRKWLDRSDARLELTSKERAKLWLAGASDIETMFSEADELSSLLMDGGNADAMKLLRERLPALQNKMQKGVCSNGSMLAKIAKRTFTAERTVKAARHTTARRKIVHEASVKLVIAQVEKTMPLTIKQRKQLVAFLLKYQPAKLVDHPTHYSYALARLRDDKSVEKFFDEPADLRRFRIAVGNAKNRVDEVPRRDFLNIQLGN